MLKMIKALFFLITIIVLLLFLLNFYLFSPIQKKKFMGNNETVLVIGRHQFIMNKVIEVLKNHNYKAFGVGIDKEAIDFVKNNKVDAVLIGGGVENESRILFDSAFKKVNPDIKIIESHPNTFLEDLNTSLKTVD